MTYATLRGYIWSWANANIGSGCPIIWANENGTRPALPYVTLQVRTVRKPGMPYSSKASATGVQTVSYIEDIDVSIQSYGDASDDFLLNLKNSLQKDTVLQALYANKVGLRNIGDITEIPIILDETAENRYLFEVSFTIGQEITDTVGFISTVEIEDTIEQPV
jgi:hypothetical protein